MDLDIVSIQEVLQHLGPNGSGNAPGGFHKVDAAEDVQLTMRWVRRTRNVQLKVTVTAFGKDESRWLDSVPSMMETIEMIEWLTRYSVTKEIHES